MPARTYSTEVCLACPAPTVKAARSASRCASSGVSHVPSPACEQVVHQLVSGHTTEIARPKVAPTDRQTPSRGLDCQ
jgi:hypothetical protein